MPQASKILFISSTLIALIAFAGNSVLCRLALQEASIDAASFTIVRLLSGAIMLLLIIKLMRKLLNKPINEQQAQDSHSSAKIAWLNGFMLFSYAACFSFAYILLGAGLGALVLFACVQLTMIFYSIYHKQALTTWQYIGLIIAFMGLVFLVFAQSSSKVVNDFSLLGFILMALAGIAWAIYTLGGKQSVQAIKDSSLNFTRSCVFLVPFSIIYLFIEAEITLYGLSLAIASGAFCSALGYAIWYYALTSLQAVQAGVVQLFVPLIAAFGGVIWIGETIGFALIISQVLILGGIALVIFKTDKKNAVS